MNIAQIKQLAEDTVRNLNILRREIQKNPQIGFDWTWEEFAMLMGCASSQTYGLRAQNRIIKEIGANTVSSKEDRGDFVKNAKYGEGKFSILTSTNPNINIVQTRAWQQLDCHVVSYADVRNPNEINISHFILSPDEMKEEIILLGSNAHGTKEATKNNANKEKRFSIKHGGKHYDRWNSKYASNLDDLRNRLDA